MNPPDPSDHPEAHVHSAGTSHRPGGRWSGAVLSLLAGLVSALVLHYLLYRVGLPSKPFIYVAF